jgi:hypothetical protein
MEPSIYFLIDDEEDRFILSLAFAGLGLRKRICFFTSNRLLMWKLQQLTPQDYPCLIGMNYRESAHNKSDLFVTLKNHVQWHTIPVILFCYNMSPSYRQKLIIRGAVACLDKASLYVDYMDMARTLVAQMARNRSEHLTRSKCSI